MLQQSSETEANFPEKFAVVRRGYSDNIWRFHCLEAKKTRRVDGHQEYTIIDGAFGRTMTGADWVADPARNDRKQYMLYNKHPQREKPLELPYWYLPGISLVKDRQRIPIIEFTCSNWFPSREKHDMIPVRRQEELRTILHDINQRQWFPYRYATPAETTPPRNTAAVVAPAAPQRPSRRSPPPSPIPFRSLRNISRPPHPQEVDDSDVEYYEPSPPPLSIEIPTSWIDELQDGFMEEPRRPRPRNLRQLVREEEEEEDIPLAFRVHDEPPAPPAPVPLPLPRHVGDMLIKGAREGKESCPISANLYSECKQLTVTSCFHVFEKLSLATWQREHDTCPVCRMKIVNLVDELGKK